MKRWFWTALCFLLFQTPAQAFEKPSIEILLSPIPPLVMKMQEGDRGLLWDLAQEIVLKLNKNAAVLQEDTVKTLPWSRAYKEMTNFPDKVMLQMARSPEREDLFHWLAPVTTMTFAFSVTTEPTINTLEDAKQVASIAVYRGSRLEDFLRSNGFDESLVLTNDSLTSARLLNAGRVQSWYGSVQEAEWLHKSNILQKTPLIGKPVLEIPVWAVASLGTKEDTLNQVKQAIDELMRDGVFKKLAAKYGLSG